MMLAGYTTEDITAEPLDYATLAPITNDDIWHIKRVIQDMRDTRPGANLMRVVNLQCYLGERYAARLVAEIERLREANTNEPPFE